MADSYFDPNLQYGNSYQTITPNSKVKFNTPVFTTMQVIPGQNDNLAYNNVAKNNNYDNNQDNQQFMKVDPPPGFTYANPTPVGIIKEDGSQVEDVTSSFNTFSVNGMSKTSGTMPAFSSSYNLQKNAKLTDTSLECNNIIKAEKIPNDTKIKVYLKHLESLPHGDYHLLKMNTRYKINPHTYTSDLIVSDINVYQSGNCKFDSPTRQLKKYELNGNSFIYNLKNTNNKYPVCNSFAIIGDVTINTLNNICDGYDHILRDFASALIFYIEQPSPIIFAFDPPDKSINCEIVGHNKLTFSISSPCTTMIGAGICKVIIYSEK